MRIGECLQFGWDTFKRHVSAFVVIGLVLFLANAAAHFAAAMVLRRFGGVIGMLVSGLFWGGMMLAARKAARGEEPSLADAFEPFKQRPGDYIIVGFAVDIGVLACGVGALVTSFLFLFAPLCVAEGGDWKQSLTRSKDLMLANVSESIVFYLVLVAVNIAGALALGVGLLVSVPVTALAIVRAYELVSLPAVLPASDSATTI
jgi:uncharacterized membrane protein